MAVSNPKPGSAAPGLTVKTKDGPWTLSDQSPDAYTLVVFYRGYHCSLCHKQLEALNDKIGAFADRGVTPVAVSMDDEERFNKTRKDWNVSDLVMGYDLDEDTARNWGLYLSSAISDSEPARFSEPGMFLVDPNNKIYAASIQSMPFARPRLEDLLSALDFINEKAYPPRGVAA